MISKSPKGERREVSTFGPQRKNQKKNREQYVVVILYATKEKGGGS